MYSCTRDRFVILSALIKDVFVKVKVDCPAVIFLSRKKLNFIEFVFRFEMANSDCEQTVSFVSHK